MVARMSELQLPAKGNQQYESGQDAFPFNRR